MIQTAKSIGLLSPREYTLMERPLMRKLLSSRYAQFIKLRNEVHNRLIKQKPIQGLDFLQQLYEDSKS